MARRKQQENAKGWDDIEESNESAGEDESAPTYDFSDLDYEDANYYMRDGIVYTARLQQKARSSVCLRFQRQA